MDFSRLRIRPAALLLLLLLLSAGCGGGTPAPQVQVQPPAAPEATTPGTPLFADVTARSGVDFTYRNGEDDVVFAIIESLGGGVAAFDYDGDGLVDLFFPAGGGYEGKRVTGRPCKLYRNLGNFRFADVTREAGLDGIDWCYSHGASVADYDRDGFPDLLVSGYSRLHLLRNVAAADGKRCFQDVTAAAKLDDRLWSASTAWGDLDGDGYPELYVTHYGDWGFDTNHPTDCYYGTGTKRDVCQPGRFKPLPHALYRNNRDGTFRDASQLLKTEKGGHGLGVLMADLNGDRKADIYVCNDTDHNHLFINRSLGGGGEVALEEKGFESCAALDDQGRANGSMGVDAASFDRSGKPAIVVTNYEGELPALYLNRCTNLQTLFYFGTQAAGLSAVGGNFVSWGTAFFDAENRGWEDLLIVNGHAIRYPLAKYGRLQKPIWMRNNEGRFAWKNELAGDYFQQMHNARGVAVADLDNDGRLDLVVSHLNAPVKILRNQAEGGGHWFGLDLHGERHRDLVGGRVVLTAGGQTQYRFIKGGGSFASHHDRRIHFGLAGAAKVDTLRIEWPGGRTTELSDLPADLYLRVDEK